MVEDAVQLIVQALASLRARDSHLTNQGELDIRLLFQFWCYTNQETPPSQVNPTPLQVLRNISSIAADPGNPVLRAECYMIIVAYLFLPLPDITLAPSLTAHISALSIFGSSVDVASSQQLIQKTTPKT